MHYEALAKAVEEKTGKSFEDIDMAHPESLVKADEGYVTSTGRFVSREEAELITGQKTGRPLMSQDLQDDDRLMARASEIMEQTGKSIEEAVHDARNERMGDLWSQRASEAEMFWSRPDIQEMITREREKLAQNKLRALRRAHKKTEEQRFKQAAREEIERLRGEGKLVSEEDLRKYGFLDSEDGAKALDEDIKALKQELDIKEPAKEEGGQRELDLESKLPDDEVRLMEELKKQSEELDNLNKAVEAAVRTECAGAGSTTTLPEPVAKPKKKGKKSVTESQVQSKMDEIEARLANDDETAGMPDDEDLRKMAMQELGGVVKKGRKKNNRGN